MPLYDRATEVLWTQTGFSRDCATDPYAGYDRIATLIFDVEHRDDRLPLEEWVLGLKLGSEARAYPFSDQAQHPLPSACTGGHGTEP